MASACVNNIGMSPESFLDCSSAPCHSYGWLSPRISLSHDSTSNKPVDDSEIRDPDPELSVSEFEFRLEDPVAMLPADELFSDGKLLPRHLSSVKPLVNELKSIKCESPEIITCKSRRRMEVCNTDPYLYSPKAPRCSSRWKELLGLKKLYHNSSSGKNENQKLSETNSKAAALKYFLNRNSKPTLDASLSLPLLKDSDCESSSRVSLSSSSSGHEYEDLHRLSLDPNPNPISVHRNPNPNAARMRMVKARAKSSENNNSKSTVDYYRAGRSPMRRGGGGGESSGVGIRGVSVVSPRMNSSGKIVFHNLERSSSSPSSFNGGPKFKNRGGGGGMERSYSANVRVTPVLNVPVCSLKSVSVFGFGQFQLFSSPQKRDGNSNGGSSSTRTNQNNNRIRFDRT